MLHSDVLHQTFLMLHRSILREKIKKALLCLVFRDRREVAHYVLCKTVLLLANIKILQSIQYEN